MEFWQGLLISIAIVILTKLTVAIVFFGKKPANTFANVATHLIIVMFLAICGALYGKTLILFFDFSSWEHILFAVVYAIIMYLLISLWLGLYKIKRITPQIVYPLVFALCIVTFTVQSVNYKKNVEEINQSILEQTERRTLLSFENLSLENLDSNTFDLSRPTNTYGVLRNTLSSDTISYCYTDNKHKSIYDTALVKDCQIYYIPDSKVPYVEIYRYSEFTNLLNKKTGKMSIKKGSKKKREKYIFYLPQSILNYTIEQN